MPDDPADTYRQGSGTTDFEDAEARIREEAYRLWEAEGWPNGRAELHWLAAKEIVAIRDSYASTLRRFADRRGDMPETVIAFKSPEHTPTDHWESDAGGTKTPILDESAGTLSSGTPQLEASDDRSALRRGIDAAVDRINRKRAR